MKKIDDEISEKHQRFFENEILNSIVIDMNKEFKKNYNTYIKGSYDSLDDLAKKVLQVIAPGNYNETFVRYIYDRFVPAIEDLFKYCDDHKKYHKQYIAADSELSDNDIINIKIKKYEKKEGNDYE